MIQQFGQVRQSYFSADGGWDIETPPLRMKPGMLMAALNFECSISGGYSRVSGYERFDGQTSPSTAIYYTIPATITGSFSVGNTLTDASSGATAVVFAKNDTGFIVTKLVGTFGASHNLQIAAVTVAVCTGASYPGGAPSSKLDSQYLALAATQYRANINAVPGSGRVLGVTVLNDIVYAFRNNAGATKALMYKSSASGWTAVAFGEEVSFSNANTSVNDGDVLTQGGVTATVSRVVVRTGTLASGVNTGTLVITGRSGGNFAAGAATSTGAGALTLGGAQSTISLNPNGKYEFIVSNFGGALGSTRLYWADGANRCHEFDGTTVVPINTGMATDTPSHLVEHLNYLMLAFGPSHQISGIGTPYAWSPILGSSEINAGDTITGYLSLPAGQSAGVSTGALMVSTQKKIKVLYGTSSSNWSLLPLQFDAGAATGSAQKIGDSYCLGDIGITRIGATADFGNFEQATVSHPIRTWLMAEKSRVVCSTICREKNQYRLFFSDGYALYMGISGNKILGLMPIQFPVDVTCVSSTIWTDGQERMFMGTSDGYVHQMEKGASFDGSQIQFLLQFAWYHADTPRVLKRWMRAAVESSSDSYVEFNLGYSIGYGTTDITQPDDVSLTSNFQTASWDSFVWDVASFDGSTLGPSSTSLEGTAENISLAIRGGADYIQPFTVTGMMVDFIPRRIMR